MRNWKRLMPGVLRTRGFTLTEMLVALVGGMVAAGAVMVYAVSAMRSNAQIIGSARLLQEMRRSLDLVTGEIRRSGYYADAARYAPVGKSAGLTDAPVIRTSSCIVVRYDKHDAPPGEYRGYRHVAKNGVGVIQASASQGFEPDCAAPAVGGIWKDITDPRQFDVLEFSFAPAAQAQRCTNINGVAVIAQEIDVRLKAQLAHDSASARTLQEAVRVRNDIMAAGLCT